MINGSLLMAEGSGLMAHGQESRGGGPRVRWARARPWGAPLTLGTGWHFGHEPFAVSLETGSIKRASNIKHQALNIKHRTSHIEHASSLQYKS